MSRDNTAINLVLLAGVGAGVFVLVQMHRARRLPGGGLPAAQTATSSSSGSSLASTVQALGGLFGLVKNVATNYGTVDGRSATQWDTTPSTGGVFNNPSAYVAGGLDGIAANPVNTDVYQALAAPEYADMGQYLF